MPPVMARCKDIDKTSYETKIETIPTDADREWHSLSAKQAHSAGGGLIKTYNRLSGGARTYEATSIEHGQAIGGTHEDGCQSEDCCVQHQCGPSAEPVCELSAHK